MIIVSKEVSGEQNLPEEERFIKRLVASTIRNVDRVLNTVEIIVNRVSLFTTLACCISLCIIINVQIAGRFVGISTLGIVEISEYMLGGIAFLGLAYSQLSRTHISVESVVSRFNPKFQTIIAYFAFVLLIGLGVLLSWYAGHLAYADWQSGHLHHGEIRLPVWIISSIAFLGYLCLTVGFLSQLWRNFIGR